MNFEKTFPHKFITIKSELKNVFIIFAHMLAKELKNTDFRKKMVFLNEFGSISH